jgi:hypothetical protein
VKVLFATVISVLLPSCAHWFGPAHGVFDVVGSTPDNRPCQLSLSPVGSTGNPREWTVTGDFKQSVMVSHSRKGHVLSLSCDNTIVATRTFKYGRDVDILGVFEVNDRAL